MDYKVEAIAGREFGSVFLGNENLAKLVVKTGWAKVISVFFHSRWCCLNYGGDTLAL